MYVLKQVSFTSSVYVVESSYNSNAVDEGPRSDLGASLFSTAARALCIVEFLCLCPLISIGLRSATSLSFSLTHTLVGSGVGKPMGNRDGARRDDTIDICTITILIYNDTCTHTGLGR